MRPKVFRIGDDGAPDLVELKDSIARGSIAFPSAGPPKLHRRSRVLRRLVAPFDVGEFLERGWGKRAIRFRDPSRLTWAFTLLSRDSLERALGDGRVPLDSVRVLEPGEPPSSASRVVEPTDLRRLVGGRSLAFSSVHLHEPRLLEACVALEHELLMPVRASAIYAPSDTGVPRARWEETSTFVVQLEGTRRWTTYGAPFPHPMPERDQGATSTEPIAPSASHLLRPGDALYIPAGLPHASRAGKASSFHLAFSVRELTWYDAIQWLAKDALRRCGEDIFFRRSCPTDAEAWSSSDQANVDEGMKRLRNAFRLDRLGDLLEDLYVSEGFSGAEPARLSHGQALAEITSSTRLARRPRMYFARATDDALVLKFANKKVLFPAKIAQAFDFVTREEHFRVSEIPGLTSSGQLVLARRLIDEGFLSRSPS